MSDVRSWRAVEFKRSSPPILVTRADEYIVDVRLGSDVGSSKSTRFEVGVNMLRPLAEALNRVAAEIDSTDVRS